MASGWDWESGEGLLGLDDPAEWDAAFERGERHIGTAAIGLAFNCSLEDASPRIVRATRLDHPQRGFAFTAAGTAARLNGALTPELYKVLRAQGRHGDAQFAIDDTLDYVPFWDLPLWFKWWWLHVTVSNKLLRWLSWPKDTASEVWEALRGRRS